MRVKNLPAESDENDLRRSGRKRDQPARMKFLKEIFKLDHKKNQLSTVTSKAKSTLRYKRIRQTSSDTEDSESNRLGNDENESTKENVRFQPKRLKLTMTPERSNQLTPKTSPTIVNPMETPEITIPNTVQKVQTTVLEQTQTPQTAQTPKTSQSSQTSKTSKPSKTSKTSQTPKTSKSSKSSQSPKSSKTSQSHPRTQSGNTQQIVVKKPDPSKVTWVNEHVCTVPLTSSSSMMGFQGESADYFWQSPIALNFVILQGRFKCSTYSDQLECGDEINVPAGEGIQISLSKGSKSGRIFCFTR